jgi:hypothetical protein
VKDLITLTHTLDTRDFVGSLWRSEAFKKSHETRGWVYNQVSRFAWMPRFFAHSTNDKLERAHFSTWWNVIILRDYENPIVHDLYYLHEMCHAATMPYVGVIGREAFDEKMQRNELEASVLSEIAVYFEMKDLRDASFQHEIYADRFLKNSDLKRLWCANKDVAVETMRTMRRHVMVSKPEADMDITEKWIRRFAEQNAAYMVVWSDRYREVEEHMEEFQLLSSVSWPEASAFHRRWLEAKMAEDPIDSIPFRQEAELFSPFYWANKVKYEEAMKAGINPAST